MTARLLFVLLLAAAPLLAEPTPAAVAAFDAYCSTVESGLHLTPIRTLTVERIPTPAVPSALLHHWRGSTFVPGATSAGFERLLADIPGYTQTFAPQVIQASGTSTHTLLRVRQHHVITVVMDTEYNVTSGHGYSIARSTRITELGGEDHGFLWRLNSYWRWQEADGGLYLQLDAVSLTRTVPRGLGWAIGPYINSIPRESLEFTLTSAANALRAQNPKLTAHNGTER